MFDLEAGIHLQEKWTVAIPVHDELDGAGGVVSDRAAEPECSVVKFFAYVLRKVGGGRLFEDLLIVALDRTITLEQMHEIAVAVAGELHFKMARVEDVFFQQYRVVAERGLGLGLRRGQFGLQNLRRDRRGAYPVRRRRRKP